MSKFVDRQAGHWFAKRVHKLVLNFFKQQHVRLLTEFPGRKQKEKSEKSQPNQLACRNDNVTQHNRHHHCYTPYFKPSYSNFGFIISSQKALLHTFCKMF